MPTRRPAARLAPLVAGLAGLAWFWFELAPQRFGFEDTDNPATGLAFIRAHPEAWQLAGAALIVQALALIAGVFALRDRLAGAGRDAGGTDRVPGVAVRTVSAIGLVAAAMLLAMGATRLSGGPVLYVWSLDQRWGETAYLVTQFVGPQLFGVGGLALLAGWIVGVAWIGARRGAIPRPVALLAVVPGLRLAAFPALAAFAPWAWPLLFAAIPAAFAWLILLGAWGQVRGASDRAAVVAGAAQPSRAGL